jgi:hypothetical protein
MFPDYTLESSRKSALSVVAHHPFFLAFGSLSCTPREFSDVRAENGRWHVGLPPHVSDERVATFSSAPTCGSLKVHGVWAKKGKNLGSCCNLFSSSLSLTTTPWASVRQVGGHITFTFLWSPSSPQDSKSIFVPVSLPRTPTPSYDWNYRMDYVEGHFSLTTTLNIVVENGESISFYVFPCLQIRVRSLCHYSV